MYFFLEHNEIKCDLVRYKVKRWLKKNVLQQTFYATLIRLI